MKVKIHQEPSLLELVYQGDESDSILSSNTVWFKFNKSVTLAETRLALIAYSLCSEDIGNIFSVEGIQIPSCLAAELTSRFLGHEFFIGGVNNVPEKLLPIINFSKMLVCGQIQYCKEKITDETDFIVLKRTVLGFDFLNNRGENILSVSTNVSFHATLYSSNPTFVVSIVMFLLAFDAIGVVDLRMFDFMNFGLREEALINNVREVAGSVLVCN